MGIRLLLLACLVGMITVVAVPGYNALRGPQPESAADADLRIIAMDIRYEDNTLSHWLEAASLSEWDDDATAKLVAMRASGPWDVDAVEALLARNRNALAKLEDGLRAPFFDLASAPEIATAAAPEFPLDVRHLVSLLEMRARLATERGNFDRAFVDAHEILRLAQRIEEANGGVLPTTMLGVAFRGTGLAVIRHINASSTPDRATSRRWSAALSSYRSNPDAWKRMWAAEYQQWKKLLGFLAEELSEPARSAAPGRPVQIASAGPALRSLAGSTAGAAGLVGAIRTNPDETLATFAERTRTYQRASERACSELDRMPAFAERSLPVTAPVGHESGPSHVVEFEPPDHREFFLKRCAEDSALAATQALIALRAYHIEHGELPDTLANLVPEYLASVPTDAFDGKPIRYSLEKQRVYSIGSDGIDDGGVAPRDAGPLSEPAFRIPLERPKTSP